MQKTAEIATSLQPHQQRVVDRMLDPRQSGLVAAHGVGSGKSLSSIAVADALDMPADVILPAALRENYLKELRKHAPTDPPVTKLQSIENIAVNQPELENPLLIVDEAHRMRNPGKTQQALHRNKALKRLLLTGSLFYNHPSDAAGPINLVAGENVLPADPAAFQAKYVRDRKQYSNPVARLFGETPEIITEINPDEKDKLRKIFAKYVDYHPSATVDFPERQDQVISVDMTSKQKAIYDSLIGKAPPWVAAQVQSGLPPSKAQAAKLNQFLAGTRQVANTTAPFQTEGNPEQPKIDRAVQELHKVLSKNPRAKALVFSNYLDAGINPYKAKLQESGVSYGEFTGEMPKTKRDQMVRDYNVGKIRALLLSRAGGEGLDLKGTRLIQLLEPHWNSEAQKQMIGRGIRFRSHADLPEDERNVLVQRFIAKNPRTGIVERMGLRKPGASVDQYLTSMSQRKEDLNHLFRELLQKERVDNNG